MRCRSLVPWLLAAVLAGCVVVPATRETYDPECHVMRRQVTLETTAVAGMQRCNGDACVAVLVATGVVTAASVVVSGSIALVGNVAYWFEKQGRCPGRPDPAQAPAPGPTSAPAT
jgi:hypothetical protein